LRKCRYPLWAPNPQSYAPTIRLMVPRQYIWAAVLKSHAVWMS
jgi:hypothetical protein